MEILKLKARKFWIGLVALAVAVSSGSRPADAAFINIPNGNTFSPSDNSWTWKASWDRTLDLTIRWDPVSKNMQKLLNIRQDDPTLIKITFEQVNRADTFDRFGLRFTLSELVTNSTTADWSVFLLQLTDDGLREGDFRNPNPNVPLGNRHPDDGDKHPTKAHFHGDSNTRFDFAPLVKLDGGESKNFIQLGLGMPVGSGRTLTGGGIGIHDWERVGTLQRPNLRTFDLLEGPVELLPPPSQVAEPSTLMLYSVGILVLIDYSWRRRKKLRG